MKKQRLCNFFFLGGGGGGGQTRCIMGDVQMANFQFYFKKKVGMLKSEAKD